MKRPAFIISEKKSETPILIIDKTGIIGEELARQLEKEALVVLVSKRISEALENIIHIPYLKKFPVVPDNVYSHIFLIDDQTDITRESLQSIIKKAQKDKAVFTFVVSLKEINKSLMEKTLDYYQKVKIVVMGDIFAKSFIYDSNSDVNKFINQAKERGRIVVPGDGLRQTYPVLFEDAITGILESTFASSSQEKIFYVLPKHGPTLLSLAHMMQKTNPTLGVDFVKEKEKRQDQLLFDDAKYIFGDNYPLENKIKDFDLELGKENADRSKVAIVSEQKTKGIFSKALYFLTLSFFILFLPLIITLLFSFLGLTSLKNAKSDVESGNLQKAQSNVYFAKSYFDLAKKSSNVLMLEANIIGKQDSLEELSQNIDLGQNISQAGIYLVEASKLFTKAVSAKDSTDMEMRGGINSLKSAIAIFQKQKIEGNKSYQSIQKIEPLINFVSTTIDSWPTILGYNGKKTYLILFQNNMELRPGGGFIGSYGLLTIEKGKILDFQINDVYDADGQLTGHVEPPYPIRRYLPLKHWYLRDSNFDVDFTKSALSAASFLALEKKQSVNGVIGVDVSFVRNILGAIGAVHVSEYNEDVTADNLFQLAESHAEKDFFPGSIQKKSFLNSLYNTIQNHISSGKKIPYLSLLQSVGDSINQKHILFAFDSNSLQNLFTVNGWSSSLWDNREQSPFNINDFVGISEANLGGNKANYYIKRSVSHITEVKDDGEIVSSLTIAYKNTAMSKEWPSGDYKNYLRLILPRNAKIVDIQIDKEKQKIVPAVTNYAYYEAKGFVPPTGLEVEQAEEEGKTVYGFLVIAPINKLQTITVNYSLGQTLISSSTNFTYNLRIFKQPGTDNYPYDFSFSYPFSYNLISVPEGMVKGENRISQSMDLLGDKDVVLNFAKK